jgi:hypothetical protein
MLQNLKKEAPSMPAPGRRHQSATVGLTEEQAGSHVEDLEEKKATGKSKISKKYSK